MSWQDWLAILGAAIGIAGIPSSYLAVRTVLSDVTELPRSAEQAGSEIFQAVSSLRSEERVLLNFDRGRASSPGTLENSAYGFANSCPLEEDRRLLITNPVGVMRADAQIAFMLRFVAVAPISLLALVWFAFFVRPASSLVWHNIFVLLISLGASSLFASTAYLLLRRAAKYKKGYDAAKAYLNYLKQREISFATEFTQSKRAFDRERREAANRN